MEFCSIVARVEHDSISCGMCGKLMRIADGLPGNTCAARVAGLTDGVGGAPGQPVPSPARPAQRPARHPTLQEMRSFLTHMTALQCLRNRSRYPSPSLLQKIFPILNPQLWTRLHVAALLVLGAAIAVGFCSVPPTPKTGGHAAFRRLRCILSAPPPRR